MILQLADLQLTWAFASVEVYWSMKEREAVEGRPYGNDCWCFQKIC